MDKIHDLSVSNYGTARRYNYDVAILPWGATEPHNLHLPYLTDAILSHDIAVDAAELAEKDYGITAMVMPPVALGAQNPGQRELPFCVHTRYATQFAVLSDIVASLYHQGMRRLLIINGHGGNSFKSMIRDLAVDYPDMLIASSEWFKVCPAKEYFDDPGDHADELETSVMMHYHPELIDLSEAGPGKAGGFKAETLQNGVAWIPRNWSRVSSDTGIGSPAASTAEKGKRFAEAVANRYAQLLTDICADDLYI
ncbi:MAG: creatininase family protein [Bacteroides sp.]|nr:creatininase family protein [Bacteroides sp.]MCM1413537.1 creatininase family protein [Bacteroides sp.]MCM1471091.1 creatininase family protein [Bacteroides sp.]